VVYILKGLKVAEQKFGEDKDAHAVMEEFRKRKQELQSEPAELAKMIEEYNMKPEEIHSGSLNHVEVSITVI
jgi:hypothetical protein